LTATKIVNPGLNPLSTSAGFKGREDGTETPAGHSRGLLRRPFFLALVLLPTLLGVLYFGFFAYDVYISESRFVVRTQCWSACNCSIRRRTWPR
jgi:hypothetical protein